MYRLDIFKNLSIVNEYITLAITQYIMYVCVMHYKRYTVKGNQ